MLRSPRNSRTGLHPHTGPQITTTPRPRTASPSSPLNRPSLHTLAVARPRPNPHSKRTGTAQYVPFLAVSSLGGFQTPAAVRAGMFVTAGVWKPSQLRSSRSSWRWVQVGHCHAEFRRWLESASLQKRQSGELMKKVGIFLLFLPAAVLVAGLFGMIHDQISYSVSTEYFTKFKFIQFHMLDAGVPERIRAAKVGFLASWWMGVPLGLLCGSAGFVQ